MVIAAEGNILDDGNATEKSSSSTSSASPSLCSVPELDETTEENVNDNENETNVAWFSAKNKSKFSIRTDLYFSRRISSFSVITGLTLLMIILICMPLVSLVFRRSISPSLSSTHSSSANDIDAVRHNNPDDKSSKNAWRVQDHSEPPSDMPFLVPDHSEPPSDMPSLLPTMTPSSSPTRSTSPSPYPSSQPTKWTNKLKAGPLVGHVTHNSVRLWAQDDQGRPLQVVYRKAPRLGHPTGDVTSVTMTINGSDRAGTVELGNLDHNARYVYEMRWNGSTLAYGEFRTATPPGESVTFDYLLASCMNPRQGNNGFSQQPVWDVIRYEREDLDFALLVGDNVYLTEHDWNAEGVVSFNRVWQRHVEQRRVPQFARFIASTPTYSTWDDHDYGDNNSNHTQPGKENSLRAFQNVWANPFYGTDEVKGIFYSFSRGDVDFFVLDGRYYRGLIRRSQFGNEQKQWLFDGLIQSTATFKIIVTASDMMHGRWERDLQDIGRVVLQNKISGVLVNAGDIHRNEIKMKYTTWGGWPYPPIQISSSGIARVWRRPFALINVNTKLDDPQITVSFYGAKDRDEDAWHNDRRLSCSKDVEKGDIESAHFCTEVIRLSDLTPS